MIKKGVKMNENKKRGILILPALIVVASVTQIPLIIAIYNSMIRWIIVRPDLSKKFIGLQYYKRILTSGEFWLVFQNTAVLTIISLAVCLILGMLFALLLYRQFVGANVVRTLLISPFFLMDSVIGIFWRNVMLNPSFGLLYYLYKFFGLTPPDMLAENPLFVIAILIIWKWTPFFLLVLLAGLQSIPEEVLEAAMVDGANTWNKTVYVILPMMMKYITISLMLGLIFILKTFGLVFTTTHGGPGFASTNFPYYVYRIAFLGWDVGKSSAIAVIIIIISLIIILVLFKSLRKSITEEV